MTIFGRYVAILAIITALATMSSKAGEYFQRDIPVNANQITYYSQGSPYIEPGDDIGIFVDNGDPNSIGKICIGVREDANPSGNWGPLDVYMDDPTTPEKDGAFPGEPLEWRVYKDGENEIYIAETDPNQVVFDTSYLNNYAEVNLSEGIVMPYNMDDLGMFCECWLSDLDDPNNADCIYLDKIPNNKIDLSDFAYIGNHWDPNWVD